MKRRTILCLTALTITMAVMLLRPALPDRNRLPGTRDRPRVLLRIWTLGSVGGGQAWLKQALHAYERHSPGVMTYLRQADPEELTNPDSVLPDLVLYLPGEVTSPECFVPLHGELPVSDALLRCGQAAGQQFSVPVCWGAYVLAIDSSLEPGAAPTPAPTTLLGKPAPTAAAPGASPTPAYPLQAARSHAPPVILSSGVPAITLRMLLGNELPCAPEDIPSMTQQEVYAAYLAGRVPTAILTTGQLAALESRITAGNAPACRIMTPPGIVTDQVWLAGITVSAQEKTADLLAWLLSDPVQQMLSAQSLQPADLSRAMYGAGWCADIAAAARCSFTAPNAFHPPSEREQLGYQVLTGRLTPEEAAQQLP